MALYGLLGTQMRLPEFAVASVNDRYITRAVYARALGAVDTDKRGALSVEDRNRVLQRLIDEELLIQYGLRQGLVRSDRQVKSTLVQAVIQAKNLQAEASEISDEEALAFFQAHQPLFARTERVRVGLIRVPAHDGRSLEQAQTRAQAARQALLQGESFQQLVEEYHEGGVLTLPNTLLPRNKLVDYLGPRLADMALSLDAGQMAEPVLVGQAWQLLYVHERVTAPAPQFAAVKTLVLAEMRRRAAESALRKSLDDMRDTESIIIADEFHEHKDE